MKKGNLTARELEEYTRVAYYYYKADFTQEEIAKRMQMSRQRVNRILASCIDLGIVKISIANLGSDLELETALERKYGLRCVRVVENVVESKVHEDLGIAAGECLASFIRKGDIIGFTRGLRESRLYPYLSYLDDNSSLIDYCPKAQVFLSHPDQIKTHLHQLSEETTAYIQEMTQELKMLPRFTVQHELNTVLAGRKITEIDSFDSLRKVPHAMIREVALPNETLAMKLEIAL